VNEAAAYWWQRRVFVAAMLLALASTLAPAMLPLEPSATRLIGSAFDPTSSAVALQGRSNTMPSAHHPAKARQARVKAPPARITAPRFTALYATPAPSVTLGASAYAACAAFRTPAAHDVWRHTTSAPPRAPPLAVA